MFKKTLLVSLSVVGLNQIASAGVVEWDTNRAVAIGSGCGAGDTAFISNGEEVSVIFANMGVSVDGFSANRTPRKACNIRIPVNVAAGHYVGELKQTLTYGIVKSKYATADLVASTRFFELDGATIRKSFPSGASYTIASEQSSTTKRYQVNTPDFSSWYRYCLSGRGYAGLLKTQFAVGARAMSANDSVTVQIDGADYRYDAVAGHYVCPLR